MEVRTGSPARRWLRAGPSTRVSVLIAGVLPVVAAWVGGERAEASCQRGSGDCDLGILAVTGWFFLTLVVAGVVLDFWRTFSDQRRFPAQRRSADGHDAR